MKAKHENGGEPRSHKREQEASYSPIICFSEARKHLHHLTFLYVLSSAGEAPCNGPPRAPSPNVPILVLDILGPKLYKNNIICVNALAGKKEVQSCLS